MDTGAGQTILSEKDARRLGVTYHDFPRGVPATGVGGVANTWRIEKQVTFYFQRVGGGLYRAARRGIEVLEEPGEQKQLPSLLGLEFLEELHFKLTYDMPTQGIFLEI
ncbi:MAG: retroviral-like aspartic protease family protein [Anaerolineae bacterium]